MLILWNKIKENLILKNKVSTNFMAAILDWQIFSGRKGNIILKLDHKCDIGDILS